MKKLLMTTVACCMFATAAFADGDIVTQTQTPDGKTNITIINKPNIVIDQSKKEVPVILDRQIVIPQHDLYLPPEVPPSYILGWVWTRYTSCPNPRSCSTVFVHVDANGLNVREYPEGRVVGSLVNGTPLTVLRREGHWTLVARQCDLVPTGLWSDTAGVPLSRCGIP